MTRLALPLVLMPLTLLAASAAARDFSEADLEGRKVFRAVPFDDLGLRRGIEVDAGGQAPDTDFVYAAPHFRGALVFDGEGAFTGFRLVSALTAPATNVNTDWTWTDNRLVPLRQELTGTYTVDADGVVTLSYTVSPARFFQFHAQELTGTHVVSPDETGFAVLTEAGGLDGFFHQSFRREGDPALGDDSVTERVRPLEFETLGDCSFGDGNPGQQVRVEPPESGRGNPRR